MKLLHEKCDPSVSLDRGLPYTAYMIEYIEGDTTYYDIATASKQSELFDHYYDKYKKDFVNMTQTEGRMNPKLWGAQQATSSSKKK